MISSNLLSNETEQIDHLKEGMPRVLSTPDVNTAENENIINEQPQALTETATNIMRAEPDSTYRLQFNSDFTFSQARALISYFSKLGVTHVYSSPFLKSVAGSRHGYDVVDQSSINPEIGTEQDFGNFVDELHANGLGQIIDVVPNHMGVASNDNSWWKDVLENGPSSPYASYFDIDWMPLKPDLANKVLLPVLGEQFGRVLEDGQLQLRFEEGVFSIQYFDRRFPIEMRSTLILLNHRLDQLGQQLAAATAEQTTSSTAPVESNPSDAGQSNNPAFMEYQSILTAINHLPLATETDPVKVSERLREQGVIKRRLRDLCQQSSIVRDFIDENIRQFNGRPGDPSSFDLLDKLLLAQSYRLAYWRVAADEINYRRFFDVNELAAICMEQPAVFERTHSLILSMVQKGQADGLRIDHPDGLYDPSAYMQCLRNIGSGLCSANDLNDQPPRSAETMAEAKDSVRTNIGQDEGQRPLYLVVEKILGRGEHIPDEWPVDGTTGYEFLNLINNLFVDPSHARVFDRIYTRFIRKSIHFHDLVYRCKKQIMKVSMSSEINMLGHRLDSIASQNRLSRDFTLNSLTDVLVEIIACFPVYRTYIDDNGVSDQDRQYIERAVARAKRLNHAISQSIFDFVRDVLLLRIPEQAPDSVKTAWQSFVGRFQQMTGPVMAKGVEDTAFYIFNRLVSLNEVGGDPDKFGMTVTEFHQQNRYRQANWPHAMLTLSTHDTKRSEDVRARINVLSEIPREWQNRLTRWSRVNQRRKAADVDGEAAPSRNDEYLLYQILLGTWPLETMNPEEHATYVKRIQDYMQKAIHEAKVHSSWVNPNRPYDEALSAFVASILNDKHKNLFLIDFQPFAQRVARTGMWNSLSQTVLKYTCPGVPDTYQGCELWDFSLVDPDNRRPVDYEKRRAMLDDIQERVKLDHEGRLNFARELRESAVDGKIKLFAIVQLLNLRRLAPGLFTTGEYLPIETFGAKREQVCAFLRKNNEEAAIVVVPRLITQLTEVSGKPPVGEECWGDTSLSVPHSLAGMQFENIFTNEIVTIDQNGNVDQLLLRDILREFPVAVLRPTAAVPPSKWSSRSGEQ